MHADWIEGSKHVHPTFVLCVSHAQTQTNYLHISQTTPSHRPWCSNLRRPPLKITLAALPPAPVEPSPASARSGSGCCIRPRSIGMVGAGCLAQPAWWRKRRRRGKRAISRSHKTAHHHRGQPTTSTTDRQSIKIRHAPTLYSSTGSDGRSVFPFCV